MNYYEILGVPTGSDVTTIKGAFRRLAKQFHPDMNPEGLARFELILKAYETLSDPALKRGYDYRLGTEHAEEKRTSRPAGKNWSFDEKELKRRRYYDEHIRKYAKETETYIRTRESRKRYNEFRYILLATPLAVLLFVLIMHLSRPPAPPLTRSRQAPSHANGESPYSSFMGRPVYDLSENRTLSIENRLAGDAVIVLTNRHGFVRDTYVRSGYSVKIQQLPEDALKLRFQWGTVPRHANADRAAPLFENAHYLVCDSALHAGDSIPLILQSGSGCFAPVTEREFFKL